jgi:carboxyl-terminal processing protease
MNLLTSFLLSVCIGALAAEAVPGRALLWNTYASAEASAARPNLKLLDEVLGVIRARYVEPADDDKLIETAIDGMVTSLDPHSTYMNAGAFRAMREEMQGEFGGLGIHAMMENGLLKVLATLDASPAARSGIRTGDIITHVDDKPLRGRAVNQAIERLRGPVNSNVKLSLRRSGRETPIDVRLTREIVQARPVAALLEGDIGYIRISQFNEQTYADFKAALNEIARTIAPRLLKGYVLDLRNNSGGLLEQALLVTDAFLTAGEIVSIKGREPSVIQHFDAGLKSVDFIRGKPLVVLVNGATASAAEIVAGALQDHRRAVLMGTRSFGKGTVQTIFPMANNGAINLTTARYYTPSGRSIQARGILPDLEVEQDVPEGQSSGDEILGEAALPTHLRRNSEDAEASGSSTYVPPDRADDRQLASALHLIRSAWIDPAEVKAAQDRPQ